MFKKRGIKAVALLVIMALMAALFAGCTPKDDALANDEPKVIRILGGWGNDDQWLRQQWTDYYELTHPNVEFEFIPMQEPQKPIKEGEQPAPMEDPYERIKRILNEGTPPDVIFVQDLPQLTKLVADGLVQPLDTFIEKEKFPIDQFVPSVVEGIRDAGDGTSLYALAPTFYSQALFYNKQLFEEAGVPFPIDGMTWQQITDLSRQLSKGEGKEQIFGLWSQEGAGFWHFLNTYAPPLGLQVFDLENKQMTLNTPEWEKAVNDYLEMAKNLPQPPNFDGKGEWEPWMDQYYQAFQMGKAAMAIMSSWELNNMKQQRMYNPDAPQFDWDIVTVPVHEEAPGIGGNVGMNGIMAINRNSQNVELGWDFISFINGEEMLKIRSRSQDGFVSRKDMIQTDAGPSNMAAFYALKPAKQMIPNDTYVKFPNIHVVWDIGYQGFQAAIKGEKTAKEVLDEMQQKGQEALEAKPGEIPSPSPKPLG